MLLFLKIYIVVLHLLPVLLFFNTRVAVFYYLCCFTGPITYVAILQFLCCYPLLPMWLFFITCVAILCYLCCYSLLPEWLFFITCVAILYYLCGFSLLPELLLITCVAVPCWRAAPVAVRSEISVSHLLLWSTRALETRQLLSSGHPGFSFAFNQINLVTLQNYYNKMRTIECKA